MANYQCSELVTALFNASQNGAVSKHTQMHSYEFGSPLNRWIPHLPFPQLSFLCPSRRMDLHKIKLDKKLEILITSLIRRTSLKIKQNIETLDPGFGLPRLCLPY